MSIAWQKDELERNVWDEALDRTAQAYAQFDNVWVSFSGGKDSTVVLNVALTVAERLGKLPLRVVFFDEEAIPFETEDYVRRIAQDPRIELEWLCLPVQHRNGCSRESPHWWPWAPEARDLWCRPLPPEAITDLPGFPVEPPERRPTIPETTGLLCPAELGSVGVLMGIRAAESMTRRRAVGNRRKENWIIHAHDLGPNVAKVYPVYDMNTNDVWHAAASFGWDYNEYYDLLEMVGIPHGSQRCAPPYGEQPMKDLWVFKTCCPDLWTKMVDRVPGAAAAARYARTEIYSFGESMELPEGYTWQELIRQRLLAVDDMSVRTYTGRRIQGFIRQHYKLTSEPLVSAMHPTTGLSWEWLYMLADRGDLKNREWRPLPKPEEFDKLRTAYLAAVKAELGITLEG